MTELASFVPLLGHVLLQFVWQGAVIGLLAWLALALLRNAKPQVRYAMACVALLTCVLAPIWEIAHAMRIGASEVPAQMLAATNASPLVTSGSVSVIVALTAPPASLLPWIVALWALGAACLTLRMACGLWWVRGLCECALPEQGTSWQSQVDKLARRFGIRRAVSLRLVAHGDSPLSAGWWKPVLLLPASLALQMPAPLLEALIAHELAHIRRHDYLINLLQSAVEVALFYHPVVWWLSHRIRVEREQVADAVAADVLGEPRRLALALSQLNRYTTVSPVLAQSARGGELMSRVQQLVRPSRRAIGSIVVLPLFGLTIAGLALCANSLLASSISGHAALATAPTPVVASRFVAEAMPVSRVAPIAGTPVTGVAPAVAPVARMAPAALVVASAPRVTIADVPARPGYALVRKGQEGFAISGNSDGIDAVRSVRKLIDGDFIWFRRGAKAYVIRDADLLARAEAAWAPTQALDSRMQSLDAKMKPYQQQIELLSTRMQLLAKPGIDETRMREAGATMEALAARQSTLAQQQQTLARQQIDASDSKREALERQMETLQAHQDALEGQMEQQAKTLDAQSARLQTQQAPMEALSRQMEATSAPMEAIGKDMETLGDQIEREAKVSDAKIIGLIDEAVQRGLAAPAPASR